jgi:hypothetical protein
MTQSRKANQAAEMDTPRILGLTRGLRWTFTRKYRRATEFTHRCDLQNPLHSQVRRCTQPHPMNPDPSLLYGSFKSYIISVFLGSHCQATVMSLSTTPIFLPISRHEMSCHCREPNSGRPTTYFSKLIVLLQTFCGFLR